MKYIVASSALALAASVVALPAGQVQKRATPTIYLAGDSTMAKAGGGAGTEGTLTSQFESLHVHVY